MTIFVTKGDRPLTESQLQKRTQAYISREWSDWERERSIRLADGLFDAYMADVSLDTDTNRANNLFNQQLVDYKAAVARLERYRLADGQPESIVTTDIQIMNEETGELEFETYTIPGIEPLEATVEVTTYSEDDPETPIIETVPNPLIVQDDEERAAAQAVVDATPQEVKDFT